MSHKWQFDVPLPVGRLVNLVGERMQRSTFGYGARPFGVGLLIAGHDARGLADTFLLHTFTASISVRLDRKCHVFPIPTTVLSKKESFNTAFENCYRV
jgi:hypothetical protein